MCVCVHLGRAVKNNVVHELQMDRQTVSSAVQVFGCKRAYRHREKGRCTACNKGLSSIKHKAKAKLSSCRYALPVNAAQRAGAYKTAAVAVQSLALSKLYSFPESRSLIRSISGIVSSKLPAALPD